jgi:hypothetical protein
MKFSRRVSSFGLSPLPSARVAMSGQSFADCAHSLLVALCSSGDFTARYVSVVSLNVLLVGPGNIMIFRSFLKHVSGGNNFSWYDGRRK